MKIAGILVYLKQTPLSLQHEINVRTPIQLLLLLSASGLPKRLQHSLMRSFFQTLDQIVLRKSPSVHTEGLLFFHSAPTFNQLKKTSMIYFVNAACCCCCCSAPPAEVAATAVFIRV